MHDPYRIRAICALLMTITLLASPAACLAAEDDEPIDRQRVNQLRQKQRNGEELTDAEKAYLQKAMEARRGRGGRARPARQRLARP